MRISFAAITAMTVATTSCLTITLLSTLALDHVLPGSGVIQATHRAAQRSNPSSETPPSKFRSVDQPGASDRFLPNEIPSILSVHKTNGLRTVRVNHLIDQDGSRVTPTAKSTTQDETTNSLKAYHGSPTIRPQAMGELLPTSGIKTILSDGDEEPAVDNQISKKDRQWLETITDQTKSAPSVESATKDQKIQPNNEPSLRMDQAVVNEQQAEQKSKSQATSKTANAEPEAAVEESVSANAVLTDQGKPLSLGTEVPPQEEQPTRETETQLASSKANNTVEIVGWPLPEQLVIELEKLEENPLTQDWAKAALDTYQSLNAIELTNPEALSLIEYTQTLAETLDSHTPQITDSNDLILKATLNRVSESMRRRAAIWAQVHKLSMEKVAEEQPNRVQTIATLISARSRNIEVDQIDPLWVEYLMLEKANEIFSEAKPSPLKQQVISRKILARITSSQLDADQIKFAQELIGNDLGWALREAATETPDLGQLLVDLEKFETKPSSGSTARLTSHYQNFYWSDAPEINEMAALLDDHYRRSNIQLELSETLMNRLIPQSTTNQEPVTDRIMGAQVRGQMQITNKIEVDLIPDDEHLSFNFQYDGRVLSLTHAHARGFTFNNLGNGLVNASKIIAVGEDGISTTPTRMSAFSRDRVEGIRGPFDDVPFIGVFSKRLAKQQQQSKVPQTKQIVEGKMRKEFRNRIDSELENQIGKANQLFQEIILRPLHTMELEPKVMKLKTTPEAVQVSYRLASLEQIGSNFSRPATEPDSLASFQLHRTAINNVINRIQISGKRFTPQQFMDHIGSLLGREDLNIPEEQNRDDVTFEFASRDPVMLDFEDDHLFINLRIKRLQVGNNHRWKNLTITTRYKPTPMGQRLYLKFDEEFGLRVGGRLRLADQLAVRTVFSALFKPDFQFDILPPRMANHPATQGMGISQLQLTEGWLTVSMNQLPAYGNISDQDFEFNGSGGNRPTVQAEDQSGPKASEASDGLLERISRRYRARPSTGTGNWK